MHSRQRLADDFRALGVAQGDVVMVHASVRSVGEVAGGPDEIHLAIKDVLTAEGTLLMYASCPSYVDEVVRGNLTAEQEAEHPISKQPWDYAFGRDSVLDRFAALDGKILPLGCDHDTVTFLHYAEHIADIPDKRVARFKVSVV